MTETWALDCDLLSFLRELGVAAFTSDGEGDDSGAGGGGGEEGDSDGFGTEEEEEMGRLARIGRGGGGGGEGRERGRRPLISTMREEGGRHLLGSSWANASFQ
ncbi:hypothetical protein Cni_G23649 [Canna indica]|uniref:Uncharacterized protein n=1 Tax=Canna indica TaxID=4628 RepID=A0AAQ3KTV5_9LILI|nr:hypothetical protein Cni_G23649 [Canna indica]